jgi:hypothetical protein
MDLSSVVQVRAGGKLALFIGSLFWYHEIMGKSIRDTKKRRGRPKTTGSGEQIGTRWQESMLRSIDAWREAQEDEPSRAEAIRRLVELGLERAPAPRKR